MSVNEVKIQKAAEPLVIKGTGPATSRTFAIGDEDHTLGNSLRHVLIRNKKVGFAGYSVPHPSEPVVQIRVQTTKGSSSKNNSSEETTAADVLKEACRTLSDQCNIVLERLEEMIPASREDRIRIEKIILEDELADTNEDEEDMMEE